MSIAVERDSRGRVIVPPRPPGMRRRALAPIFRDLVRALEGPGKAFATEAGQRREVYRRTGYICGVRSLSRVRDRLVACGELGTERVLPYHPRVDGNDRHPGTTHVWTITRAEQRKAKRRAAAERRQEQRAKAKRAAKEEHARLEAEQQAREEAALERAREEAARQPKPSVALIPDVLGPVRFADLLPKPPPPPEPAEPTETLAERRRLEVARQLAELRALGFDDDKPPDK